LRDSAVLITRARDSGVSRTSHTRAGVGERAFRAAPRGAIAAMLMILFVHVSVVRFIYPTPIARDTMRRKIIALTETDRPTILIAGDCRAAYQVNPTILASGIGQPAGSVVSVATPGQTPAAVLAALREYGDRFARRPVVVISISVTLVNDTVAGMSRTNELLWSLDVWDRRQIVSNEKAVVASFLPEQTLLKQWQAVLRPANSSAGYPDYGFETHEDRGKGFSPDALRSAVDSFRRFWVVRPRLRGVAWEQAKRDLHAIVDTGAQVVVLDTPLHPALAMAIADTPDGETYRAFRRMVAEFCQRQNVPLLAYDEGIFDGRNPDPFFYSVTQLNGFGARLLTRRIAADLNDLFDVGMLALPSVEPKNRGPWVSTSESSIGRQRPMFP